MMLIGHISVVKFTTFGVNIVSHVEQGCQGFFFGGVGVGKTCLKTMNSKVDRGNLILTFLVLGQLKH